MGIKTAYDGYKAYSYLEEGKDFPYYEMVDWNWAGEYRLPLNAEQEERVNQIARDKVFIALHEHPTLFPKNITETIAHTKFVTREFCAYEGLSKSYIDCIFDNMMDGTNTISSNGGWKWQDIIHDLGMRLCDIAHQDFLIQCKGVEDIHRAHREGKIAWVPVIEGAAPIENELDRIDILYGLGVRQLGVTYSESNALGNGMKEENDGGLTYFGKKAVERMNKVGMLIDVSHCGPKTAYDVVMHSKDPIIASHVGARSLWDIKRLFSDDLIKAIASKGGVIAVEAAPHTTMTKTNMTHDIEAVMEHFQYMVDLVGIDHVSFGIDSLYGDHVGLHHLFASHLSTKDVNVNKLEYEEVEYVKGLENPTEASWNIIRWLVKHNYSDEDIEKVIGGNALRVLEQVWK